MVTNIVIEDEYRLRQLKRLDAVVDVGANIGVFALHAWTLFKDAHIHCYEPDVRSHADFQFNTRQLPINLYSDAISDREGVSSFLICDNHTSSALQTAGHLQEDQSQSLEVTTIDLNKAVDRLGIKSDLALLKLDCEGAEYSILKQPAIKYFRYIVGELHTVPGFQPSMARDMLVDAGFALDEYREFKDGKAIAIARRTAS